MRVLHISKGDVGGLDTIVSSVANARGESVVLLSNNDSTSLYKFKTFLKCYKFRGEVLLPTFQSWFGLFRMSRGADIVHIHLTNVVLFFIWPLLISKKRIFSIHKNFGEGYASMYGNALRGILFTIVRELSMITYLNFITLLADKIVLLTYSQKNTFAKRVVFRTRFEHRAVVINNFISNELIVAHKAPSKCSRTVMYIGRLSKYKGFEVFLKIVQNLSDENFNFIVIGEGALASKIPRSDRVLHVPSVENARIHEYLDMADILVLPSYSETFGMVILEAMARGLAVCASDLPAIREYFKSERNGYLVEPGNASALTAVIKKMSQEPELLAQISNNNVRDIRDFTDITILPVYDILYEKISSNR